MATIAAEPPADRRRAELAKNVARRVAMLVLVLAFLWGLWEGYRWFWIREGWTWPFVVDSTTMPHIHDILRQLFRKPTSGVGGDILLVQLLHAAWFTAKEALVGFALGASFGFDTSFFTTGTNMITPRIYHTATLMPNGKVLVAGGDSDNGLTSSAELFDPATGTGAFIGIPRRSPLGLRAKRSLKPLLGSIQTSAIRSRIGVSRWYAGRIRQGYIPHPRHWRTRLGTHRPSA